MITVKAARLAGVVARHRRRGVMPPLRRAAVVQMSGKADASEYTAWAKNADSLPSWDGDVETMHEWYRIDYDDRGFTMDVRPNYNKENPWTADVAWEDVTRICFHVGGPPLVPHDVYVFVKGRHAPSWVIPSEALMNGQPPDETIMGRAGQRRGMVTPPEQFMIKLVEKRLFTVELFQEAILQKGLGGVVCYPNFGEPGHDGSSPPPVLRRLAVRLAIHVRRAIFFLAPLRSVTLL